jgi:hypothetical protein
VDGLPPASRRLLTLEFIMTVESSSISLDQEIAARARHAAELEGMSLSGWLAKAVDKAARLVEARAAWKEYVALFGEPDPEAVEEMDRKLAEAGCWRKETPEERAARLAALAFLRGQPRDDLGNAVGMRVEVVEL